MPASPAEVKRRYEAARRRLELDLERFGLAADKIDEIWSYLIIDRKAKSYEALSDIKAFALGYSAARDGGADHQSALISGLNQAGATREAIRIAKRKKALGIATLGIASAIGVGSAIASARKKEAAGSGGAAAITQTAQAAGQVASQAGGSSVAKQSANRIGSMLRASSSEADFYRRLEAAYPGAMAYWRGRPGFVDAIRGHFRIRQEAAARGLAGFAWGSRRWNRSGLAGFAWGERAWNRG